MDRSVELWGVTLVLAENQVQAGIDFPLTCAGYYALSPTRGS